MQGYLGESQGVAYQCNISQQGDALANNIKKSEPHREPRSFPSILYTVSFIFSWSDSGSHLVPIFGQQDETVIVDQETVQVLDRKRQKAACVYIVKYKSTNIWWLSSARRRLVLTALSQLSGHTPSTFAHWDKDDRRSEERRKHHILTNTLNHWSKLQKLIHRPTQLTTSSRNTYFIVKNKCFTVEEQNTSKDMYMSFVSLRCVTEVNGEMNSMRFWIILTNSKGLFWTMNHARLLWWSPTIQI